MAWGALRVGPAAEVLVRQLLRGLVAPAAAALVLSVGSALLLADTGTVGQQASGAQSLAPYVPTPQDVVERMLELAGVTRDDVVYDLGCGDGRLVITAARKYGARGVGVDIDPERIAESEANARKAGVESLVSFRLQDAMKVDVSPATVVTLYLLSSSNMRLRPQLTAELRPGARIVSHAFSMGDWTPEKVETFRDANGSSRTLYLWKADGKSRP
jgi:SAM-dependent methyltransferase